MGGALDLQIVQMNKIAPQIVNVELTNACNLACTFCDHSRLASTMITSSMDPVLLARIMDRLSPRRFHELGLVGLGEPLLDRHLAEHLNIVGAFSELFDMVSMNTNGVAMSADQAELICSSAVTHITFSLNAANPETYARLMGADVFYKAVSGVKLFMETRSRFGSGQNVSIQMISVGRNNDLAEIKSVLGGRILSEARLFVRKVYNKPAVEINRPTLEVHRASSQRHPCWSLYSRIYIDVSGNLYPCTVGNDCYREDSSFCLGNIRSDGVFAPFNGKKIAEARARAERGLLPFAECGSCNIWSLLPNNFDRHEKSGRWIRQSEVVRLKDMDWQVEPRVVL